MAEDGYKVSLHVYDLSQGLARQLSTTLLGKVIEGIWHTGLVVYGNEYYFGGGIQHDPVGNTPYGTPVKVVDLGITHVPKELFEEYLEEISPRYTAQTYNLLQHNCNNFSNEVAQFLVGVAIPDYILNLPNEVMSSPMGAMMLPMIQQLETTLRQNAVPQPPQFRPKVNAQPQQPKATSSAPNASSNCNAEGKPDTCTARESPHSSVPPTLKPAESQEEKNSGGAAADPLRDARGRVHEEIAKEFAAIMATGTLQASEAAVLAARRVMERHGRMNAAPLTQG